MKITLDKIDISGNLNNFAQYLEKTDRADSTCKCTTPQSYKIFS